MVDILLRLPAFFGGIKSPGLPARGGLPLARLLVTCICVVGAWSAVLLVPAHHCSAEGLEPLSEVQVPSYNPQTEEKVRLGKRLFFDTMLSGDGTMSCASCHNPLKGFADGLGISAGFSNTSNWRNTPTVINVAFSGRLFHDGRALSLEEQALFPIIAPFMMNQNLEYLEEEVMAIPAYVEGFRAAFGGEANRERIAMALASFQRTLVSRNSPLDRHLAGERGALSREARKGLEVFTGKGGCLRCHHGPALTDDEFYSLGVPENQVMVDDTGVKVTIRYMAKVAGFETYAGMSADPGRYFVTKDKKDWNAFNTPSLREVSRTSPYMHNGVFGSIEEVIDFMDRGGENPSGPLRPLGLSDKEKRYLASFLTEALTGEDIVVEGYEECPETGSEKAEHCSQKTGM